jgi:hypothetical protein
MANLNMTTEQRRLALITARRDLEGSIYVLAVALGLDVDSLDEITHVGSLWHDPETDLPTVDSSDPEWPNYMRLGHMTDRLALIIDKLEGPNRIV